MSTTPTITQPGLWKRWLNFWFAPIEPTTLGFIRLVTGFAVLYVHLAYCFDLRSFFGPQGWYGLEFSNRERREQPSVLAPFWGKEAWDEERVKGAHIPEYPHRKQAVMQWLRDITSDPVRLNAALPYLERMQKIPDENTSRILFDFPLAVVGELTLDPNLNVRLSQATQLVKEKLLDRANTPTFRQVVPVYLADMPADGPNGRTEYAKDLSGFIAALPREPMDRIFVLNHYLEMDQFARKYFLEFIRDAAKLEPAQRTARLDYMEYWNQEERYAFALGVPLFSLWFHITDPIGMAVAHGTILLIIFLFAVGFCTRVTSVLTWLAAVSYIHRTQQVLFGMDTMMNILLIYLMIGNSGAALSVDRLIARYRASRNSLRKTGGIDSATRAFLQRPPSSVSAAFALRLLQVHFCFIYMAAGLSKLKGQAWWNTNAYWDTLVNPEFTLIHYYWYESLVRQMVEVRPFYQFAAAFGVIFTFVAEIGLPFLVWTRLRPYAVIMGFLLHAGVAVFMGLWIFSLLMMTMLLGYLPSCVVRERLFGTPSTTKLTVRINRNSAKQSRAAALLTAADFDGQITFTDGPDFAVIADGKSLTKADAVRTVFTQLTWLKMFSWVPRLPIVGSRLARLLTGAE